MIEVEEYNSLARFADAIRNRDFSDISNQECEYLQNNDSIAIDALEIADIAAEAEKQLAKNAKKGRKITMIITSIAACLIPIVFVIGISLKNNQPKNQKKVSFVSNYNQTNNQTKIAPSHGTLSTAATTQSKVITASESQDITLEWYSEMAESITITIKEKNGQIVKTINNATSPTTIKDLKQGQYYWTLLADDQTTITTGEINITK